MLTSVCNWKQTAVGPVTFPKGPQSSQKSAACARSATADDSRREEALSSDRVLEQLN
jgi:hypothetical protein